MAGEGVVVEYKEEKKGDGERRKKAKIYLIKKDILLC